MKDSNEMIKALFERRENYYIERRRKMKKAIGSLACCLVVLFAVSIPVTNYFSSPANDHGLLQDAAQNAEQNHLPSAKKEMMPNEIMPEDADTENAADAPVPDSSDTPGPLVPYEEVWGGAYQNEAGKWVILLTENTPENQKKFLELNPALTENDIIFQAAAASMSYLRNLMISIAQAVDDNEEFSFVSSIGLREDCVDVYVTTDDPESIAKILAFDTLGGGSAIKIVNLNSYAAPEENQKGPKY